MIALLALLVVSAPPPLQAVLPNPAQTLPHLKAGLTWAGKAAPELRPAHLRRVFRPLGLDPLSASPQAWADAGLHPDRPARLTVRPDGSIYVHVELAKPSALRAHLEAQKGVHLLPKPGLGFVAGRPGRPTLVGAVHKKMVWLRAHRPLLTVPPKDRADQARRLVKALRVALSKVDRPPRFRLRVPGMPRQPPDAQLQGLGPAPAQTWTGALWLGPKMWTGAAHIELDDMATILVKDWLPGRRAPRRLLPVEGAVLQANTRADPRALLDALGALPKIGTGLLTGEVHAALTPGGSLVVALALRPGVHDQALSLVPQAVGARYPGVRWRRVREPDRLVMWFAGGDSAGVEGWFSEPLKGPRGPRGATLALEGPSLLPALAARAQSSHGPRLGTVQRAGLRMLYGAFLKETHHVTVQVINARRGIDVRVGLRGDFALD